MMFESTPPEKHNPNDNGNDLIDSSNALFMLSEAVFMLLYGLELSTSLFIFLINETHSSSVFILLVVVSLIVFSSVSVFFFFLSSFLRFSLVLFLVIFFSVSMLLGDNQKLYILFEFTLFDFFLEVDTMGYKECPNCGAMVDEDETICPECGYSFKDNLEVDEQMEKDLDSEWD